jgi:plastocyanin
MATNDHTSPPSTPSYSGFTLLVATMALLLSIGAMLAVAFKLNDSGGGGTYVMHHSGGTIGSGSMTNGNGVQGSMMGAGGAAETGVPTEEVGIVVKSDEEHAKRGPEGTWHDAYLPASFAVTPGATVKVTFLNYDEGQHSFTSMSLGLNIAIAAGSSTHPKATTITFRAPSHRGTYLWYCAMPCDPWAMSHVGYMRGYVSVA